MTLEKWEKFGKRDQIGHIGAEILRASQNNDSDLRKAILEKALGFVDLSLQDKKWLENPLMLLVLRNALAEAYLGEENLNQIYAIL